MRLVALLALLASPLAAQANDTNLATFDAAARIVERTHFDTTFNGVNWIALRDSLRPFAIGASRDSVRTLIRVMLARLGQSHFSVFPSDVAEASRDEAVEESGTIGAELAYIGGRIVVERIEPDGAAKAAGVEAGWVVTEIGNAKVDSVVEGIRSRPGRYSLTLRAVRGVSSLLLGPVESSVMVQFLDGHDRPVSRTMVRRADTGPPVKWGYFPTFFARFHAHEERLDNTRAGVIWFSNWVVPLVRQVDSAVDAYRAMDGMVIDLRRNSGGVAAMVGGVAGHFTARPDTLGINQTRSSRMVFVANPRRSTSDGRTVQPFAGPVAVLVDELSGSASEIFAAGMRAVGRVRVFGATSIGGVLPASWDRLPNGDVLYHAIGEFITPSGEHLEGLGVVPDEPVPLTRSDLLAGRDPVLNAAMRWIAGEKSRRTGATP
ncbi:MAG TPA: S41 family peptidase [Gemmatimonadales bacterium]|nr:S41 family peptidase [Gemmatimonadales bacterium]